MISSCKSIALTCIVEDLKVTRRVGARATTARPISNALPIMPPPPKDLPFLTAAVLARLPAATAARITHTASPACTPTWTAPSDEVLTASARATRWASGSTARCALPAPARARAPPLLAHLPALADAAGGGEGGRGGVVLVVVDAEFLHFAVAAGGLYDCPLPAGLPRGAVFSRVFASTTGLIVEVETGNGGLGYWSLMHPLEEMVRIQGFGLTERLVFASADAGVAVTYSGGRMSVWSIQEAPVVESQDSPDVARAQYPTAMDVVDDNDFTLNRVDNLPGRGEKSDVMIEPVFAELEDPPLPSQRVCLTAASLQDVMFRTGSGGITAGSVNSDVRAAPMPSAFMAHNSSGEVVLCLVAGGRLTAMNVVCGNGGAVMAVTPSFRIDNVTSATGILATRRAHAALDIAVLHSAHLGGAVIVYAGDMPMCSLRVPTTAGARIVELRDAVGCRVTARLSDGFTLRLSLRAASSPSALVNQCVGVLSRAFLDSAEMPQQNPVLEIQRAMLARALPCNEQMDIVGDPDERDGEWLLFVDIIASACLALCGKATKDHSDVEMAATRPEHEMETSTGSSSDWRFLMGSEHHRMSGSSEALAWCSSSTHNPAQSSMLPAPLTCLITATTNPNPVHLSSFAAVRILESLHLLYEDMKLSVTACAHRHRLASFLSKLAGILCATDLSDYYNRDFNDLHVFMLPSSTENSLHLCSTSGLPDCSGPFKASARVPSIYDWLSRCVQFRQGHLHDAGDASPRCRSKEGALVKDVGNERRLLAETFPVLLAPQPGSFAVPSMLQASWACRSPLDRSEKVMRYYSILFGVLEDNVDGDGSFTDACETNARPQQALRAMCADGFGPCDLDTLSFGVALPLREALWACRVSPGEDLPSTGDILVGREDLCDVSRQEADIAFGSESDADSAIGFEYRSLLRIHAASKMPEGMPSEAPPVGEESLSPNFRRERELTTNAIPENADEEDGCEITDSIYKLRFSKDRRVSEVRRLLRSTDPVSIHLSTISGEELEKWPEEERPNDQPWLLNRLHLLLKRHLAAPVGRGAFTLRTVTPKDPTMPLSIPPLCLKGTIAGQKGAKLTFNPDSASYRTDWGDFHNGVAAGLRLVASGGDAGGGGSRDGVSLMTRTWIVNHRPSNKAGNASHAGMLLALGLGGYLPALRATDYYEYLVPMHDLTTIGLMLGVAAGNRGSLDAKITKMLCVHIRHFNGPGFAVPDFHVSLAVQAAAVLGIGLLYQGTCEHLIVEGLLVELARRPQPGDAVQDRECLSLSTGLALGLVCLGVGRSVASLADLHLLDTLSLYAMGGTDPSVGSKDRGADGREAASGLDSPFDGDAKPSGGDGGMVPPTAADSETSKVREGPFVNVDVTGPGALLALTLVYLKSNDSSVADRILLPGTMYALDRARPDHIYLRCLARHLIMWDSIETGEEWILSSLPELLMPPVRGKGSSTAFDLSHLRYFEDPQGSGSAANGSDIDEDGILLARAFAFAGAGTAIALRYAGSMDPQALSTLVCLCTSFEAILERQVEDNEEAEWVYGTCLNAIGLAIAIVAAGSGDLDMLRLLRRVRKRSGPSLRRSRYGAHMANHMAIGFLFLGGGCLTFGTSNIAVASLLCAIYPRFPIDVEDNQYHLQAMRHMYVLAVEPRCIEARDVDTDLPCSVDVEITLSANDAVGGTTLSATAPCLLPNAEAVGSIAVVSERYWPKIVSVKKAAKGSAVDGWFSSTHRQVLYVKRRAGHLPHDVDPTGSKGMLARSFGQPRQGDTTADHSLVHLVKAFSADPMMRTFVGHFCEALPTHNNGTLSVGERTLEKRALETSQSKSLLSTSRSNTERYGEVLYECLSLDKPEAIQCYLEIDRAIFAMASARACPATVGSLALLSEYAAVRRLWGCVPLVRRDFLWRSILQARAVLDTSSVRSSIARYILDESFSWRSQTSSDVGRTLQLYRAPNPHHLQPLRNYSFVDEDEAWVAAGLALPPDTPADAVEYIVRVLSPHVK